MTLFSKKFSAYSISKRKSRKSRPKRTISRLSSNEQLTLELRWEIWRDTGCEVTFHWLIQYYTDLVPRVVGQIQPRLPEHIDRDDLSQHGFIGLIDAIRRHSKGIETFRGYACLRIRGEIVDFLRKSPLLANWKGRNSKMVTFSTLDDEAVLEQVLTGPEGAQYGKEDLDHFLHPMESISPRWKYKGHLLRLRHVDGYSPSEIAKMERKSEKDVKASLQEARFFLREICDNTAPPP